MCNPYHRRTARNTKKGESGWLGTAKSTAPKPESHWQCPNMAVQRHISSKQGGPRSRRPCTPIYVAQYSTVQYAQ